MTQWSLPPTRRVGVVETTKQWGVLCRGAVIRRWVRRAQPHRRGGDCCGVGL